MKYKYKKGDKVWGNAHTLSLPWKKGTIINRWKRCRENMYTIRHIHGVYEVAESDIQLEE